MRLPRIGNSANLRGGRFGRFRKAAAVVVANLLDHSGYTGLDTGDDHPIYVLDAIAAAKGDLLVATADDTIDILTVGADNTLLRADSALTPGVGWS